MGLAYSELIPPLLELMKSAGEAILSLYQNPTPAKVELKTNQTPVTEADKTSHTILTNGLQQLNPLFPILSEEGNHEDFKKKEYYWLIDPLDGTQEFLHKSDEFTINCALIKGHQPVLGVVYLPVFDCYYYAIKGQKAFKQFYQQPRTEISVRKCQKPPTIVVSRHYPSKSLQAFLEKLGPYQLKQKGSALKICLVAEGRADLYPRFGPTSLWDTAAGQCIVEAAGGALVDFTGSPLTYHPTSDFLNPSFMVIGDHTDAWLHKEAFIDPQTLEALE